MNESASQTHPTSIFGESVQLVVGDEVGLEVLLPVADALHTVVGVRVDVDGPAEVVGRPAVGLVDRDLLLVGVAHGHTVGKRGRCSVSGFRSLFF